MNSLRKLAFAVAVGAAAWMAADAHAQIVINEIVEDEQDFESTDVTDNREFIEIYNAGTTAVNIGNWQLKYWLLGTTAGGGSYFATTDTIPAGTMLAPNDYWVIGADTVPNVDQALGSNIDLFPNANTIFELRDGSGVLKDAVGLDTFRNVELANASQEQLDQIAVGQTVGPTARGGWWGQIESNDAHPSDTTFPNLPMSIGRYRDGLDHNDNGRDFGMIPVTPGATNNLAQVSVHTIPNVDALAAGTELRDNYYASFKLPRVIDPTQVGPAGPTGENVNPNVISASPQGGKAIIAWDETGGGNADYSDQYSNEFKLYAYIDPRPFNVTTADSNQSEASIYGIAGSTDVFFATPNSADLLTGQPGTGGNITSSANGSTGIGWLIQRRTSNTAGTQASAAVLQLIDFNNGGDGVMAVNDWQIKKSIDLTGMSAGWHVLGIKYDPTTGNVAAVYDNETYNFITTTDLVGNFYVGYREQLPGTGDPVARPPTYDLFVAPPGVPGDYNGNNVVDAADYVLWRKGGPLQNEVDNPGTVNQADYTAWRARFGNTFGSGAGQSAAVPEPSAFVMVLAGFALARIGRERRKG